MADLSSKRELSKLRLRQCATKDPLLAKLRKLCATSNSQTRTCWELFAVCRHRKLVAVKHELRRLANLLGRAAPPSPIGGR